MRASAQPLQRLSTAPRVLPQTAAMRCQGVRMSATPASSRPIQFTQWPLNERSSVAARQLIAIFCEIDDFCKAFAPVYNGCLLHTGQRGTRAVGGAGAAPTSAPHPRGVASGAYRSSTTSCGGMCKILHARCRMRFLTLRDKESIYAQAKDQGAPRGV